MMDEKVKIKEEKGNKDNEIVEKETKKMDKEQLKQEMNKRKEWIKCWFAIEVMANSRGLARQSLEEHVERMSRIPSVFVYKKDFSDVQEVPDPPEGIKEAYSLIVNIELLVKDVYTLLNIVMVYGPSAVEILEPNKITMNIDELQNTVNVVASLVHQFAAAGVGGLLIPQNKKTCG